MMLSGKMAANRLFSLFCVYTLCISFLVHFSDALNINRVIVPHTARPGYVVSSLAYWGQTFRVDTSHKGEIARHFSVLTNGDVITNCDISELLGQKIDLIINSELASESWKDTVSLDVQDGNAMLLLSQQYYEGHITENQPHHVHVRGLENLKAKIEKDSDKVIHYKLTSEGHKSFKLKKNKINGIEHVKVISKETLDREEKHKHVLTIKAFTDSQTDTPAFAQVTIYVDDVNDNIPKFEKSHYHTTIADTTPAMSTVLRVKAVDPDDSRIKYVMSPNSVFNLDSDRGVIIMKSRKALEPQSYEMKVYAEDEDGKTSEPTTVHVEVQSEKQKKEEEEREKYLSYEPVFEPFDDSMAAHHPHSRYKRETRSPKEFEVPESMVGELIRLSENLNERFTFKDPAPKNLEINRFTGAVRLKDGNRLDFEDEDEISFIVLVSRDDSPGSATIEQPVKIKLTDVNDEEPRFVNVPRPFLATVSQNAPPGTSVYQLMSRDDDKNSILQYNLESGGENRFEVDPESGVVRTRGNQPFTLDKEYEIGVSSQDVAAITPQKSPTQSLKILVGERDPQFFQTQYIASVPEDARTQYEIVEVKAYSHQGYPIRYELMEDSGANSNQFAIHGDSGTVDLLQVLDYEKDPQQYHLKVRAIEIGRPLRSSSVNLIINLIDMNDNKPMFPLSQYIVQGIAETVPNGTHIIQVTATDLDSVTNSQLTYSVSDGNFTVESLNNIGYIKTARTLDYDHTRDHTYNFTVVATDNGSPPNNGSATVRVTVTNVNDEDPVFMQSIEHVQVSEDASSNTVVHVVQAYDPDGDDVTYSFVGDRLTEGPFRIDPNSGIITLVGQMDKKKVMYKLNITATDNGRCCGGKTSRSSRGLVVVEVKDINNNAPRFPDCAGYKPSVLERQDVGTSVIRVRAEDSDTGANGNVTYSLVKSIDQDSDRFTIDPITGIIVTAEVFDREARTGVTDYGVTIKAEDQGSPSLAGFCTFRVKIGDKNDNPPVFDFPDYETSLEEASAIGKRVLQVYATDKDAGDNGQVEYYMKSDPSGFFSVNRHSGWITVRRAMSGKDEVMLEIEARDKGTPSKKSTVPIKIIITQTVNAYPQWLADYSATPIPLPENVPVNYVVKRLKAVSTVRDATKPDSDKVNYVIQPGETPEQNGIPRSFWWTMNDTTNEMLLRVYRSLDFETTPRYTLTIKAANRATNSLHNDTRVIIELIDKNDEIPQFVALDQNGRYDGRVAENLAPGAEVIQVTATDRDEFPEYNKIAYSLKPIGRDHAKFDINPETGVITTRETFDREEKDEYYITVVAQDGARSDRPNHYPPGTPNQGEAEVQVRITDKNDNAPFFKHRQYNATVPENTDVGAVIMTVTSEDEDDENRLTYSITGGNIGNAFEVVPDLGQLKVRGNLDYENGPREYRLTYRVFDDKFANTATVVVKVTDVNDNPPRFDPSEYVVEDVVEEDQYVSEANPKFLIRVHAEDPDINRRSNIRYGLTGQFYNEGYFTINEITGDVYITKKLDRDKPNGRAMWSFNVLAHDEPGSGQSLTGYAVVKVRPKDINDNSPRFDANRLKGKVPEHSRAGVSVLTVIATDEDSGNNGTVMYSLKQVPVKDGTPLFAINPNTGLITTTMNNALDRETQPEYRIIVQARDQGTPESQSVQRSAFAQALFPLEEIVPINASATVTIQVDDINDHAPKFTQKLYQATMSENFPAGASVTSVSATDRDIGTNAKLTYTLKEQDREFFSMTSVDATNTGVLKVFRPVDYDTLVNPFFNLTVYVRDSDTTHVNTAHIEVYVTDFNDNPPIFVPNSQKVTENENVHIGKSLARFSATDRDQGMNKMFSYSIDRKTDEDRKFNIDPNGLVTVTGKLDRENTAVHRVHILAVDKGMPPQTGTGTLIITLRDVNDNFPIFAQDYRPVIYEQEERGQTVVTISAIDKDTAQNGPPFEFWLPCRGGCPCTENPTCGDFAFRFIPGGGMNGHGQGIVTSRRSFDREKQKEYYMPIIMKDSGQPQVTGTNTLTIIIGDKNDNVHYPGHKEIFVYNYRGNEENIGLPGGPPYNSSEFENAPLGNVNVEDPDDWDRPDKEFSFVNQDTRNFFTLDKETGEIFMRGKIREGDYNFNVIVYDRYWKREVRSSVTVKVREIGDEAIFNSGSIRLTGITAEEFVDRPKIGPGTNDYGKSKYDLFREKIARKLSVPTGNVDIFTVLNHPELPKTVDVRFAAHGSPYYRPARLDGIINQFKIEFEEELGLNIAMVPIDECLKEKCEGGCSNKLVVNSDPLLINTNGTSLIGVTSFVKSECECTARKFEESGETEKCRPDSCLNGGTCIQREHDFLCECARNFKGPRCQQTHISFSGDGWAWFKPLAQCEDSHTSLEFMTFKGEGIIMYNGPIRDVMTDEVEDFVLLELRKGYPILRINHGTGEAKLQVDGRDRAGNLRLRGLNDGKWHKIDIFRTGSEVRMVVDDCKSATIEEDEYSQTFDEDRAACQVERTTPGENQFINVNTPLQLGGRSNPNIEFPPDVDDVGFDGCIKNLIHDGQLYDLHIGRVGEHKNAGDGCLREDAVCGANDVGGAKCGANGTCVGSFQDEYKCVCNPGSRGHRCETLTPVKDFQEHSYIEWDFKEQFHRMIESRPYTTELQLMFRTRHNNGLLFKVQNIQKSEYMIMEIKERKIRFRYNLGTGEEIVYLNFVNVTDGQWHTVNVQRIGKTAVMKLDGGEGKYYNRTEGTLGGHLNIKVARRQFYAGGDVKFPAHNVPAIVDYDYRDSCMNDIRFDDEWLPMDSWENSQSKVADLTRSANLNDSCKSDACNFLACTLPLECTDLWRYAECRCPFGQKLVPNSKEICINIDECLGSPCVNGECIDRDRGFECSCFAGYSGTYCTAKEEAYRAYVSHGFIIAIIICVLVVLLLALLFFVYSRRRHRNPVLAIMDPDDDVRENIIHYDEEGVGEEDQDAYDINRLKKPVDDPPTLLHKPPVERDMPPPLPEKERPRKRFAPGEQPDVGDFINHRLGEADGDPTAPPHDSVREYAYEGGGSDAGSLSSLASAEDTNEQTYDYLNDWGPRFTKLKDMYGNDESD